MKAKLCICGHTKASHTRGKYYCQKGFKGGIEEKCKCMAYRKEKK